MIGWESQWVMWPSRQVISTESILPVVSFFACHRYTTIGATFNQQLLKTRYFLSVSEGCSSPSDSSSEDSYPSGSKMFCKIGKRSSLGPYNHHRYHHHRLLVIKGIVNVIFNKGADFNFFVMGKKWMFIKTIGRVYHGTYMEELWSWDIFHSSTETSKLAWVVTRELPLLEFNFCFD